MPFLATKDQRGNPVLTGPKGDTIDLTVTSTDTSVVWSGWTWLGQVRTNDSTATLKGTFSIVDSSTAQSLALVCTMDAATTATWTSGEVYKFAIQGTKAGVVKTFIDEGRIVVTDDIAV